MLRRSEQRTCGPSQEGPHAVLGQPTWSLAAWARASAGVVPGLVLVCSNLLGPRLLDHVFDLRLEDLAERPAWDPCSWGPRVVLVVDPSPLAGPPRTHDDADDHTDDHESEQEVDKHARRLQLARRGTDDAAFPATSLG